MQKNHHSFLINRDKGLRAQCRLLNKCDTAIAQNMRALCKMYMRIKFFLEFFLLLLLCVFIISPRALVNVIL